MKNAHDSCQILIKLELTRQILKKSSNIKFHKNSLSVSGVVPRGQVDGQTDMTKIAAFRIFANTPNKKERNS
jgi:hypothetical protein